MIAISSRQSFLAGKRDSFLVAVIAFAIIAAAYYRLYFGVNFIDEAFYIAMPFRYVLGDIPFRDEASTISSMFPFISYPFFKLFYALSGSTEGIILFARHLYFVFQIGVSAGTYLILQNYVSKTEAILISSCVLVFVPFKIAGISYNSLSAGFLALGLLAGAWGVISSRPGYMVTSGFVLTLCVAAYPPMLLTGLVVLVNILRQSRKSIILYFLAGCCLAVIYLLPLLRHFEWNMARDNMDYVLSFSGKQVSNWAKSLLVVWNNFRHLCIGIAASGVICIAIVRNGSAKVRAAVVILPLILALGNLFPTGRGCVAAHGFVVALALIGPWIYRGINGEAQKFFKLVWIPSAVAALVMGYSSSIGYFNSGIGFLGGAIISLTMLLVLLRDKNGSESARCRDVRLFIAASAAGILIFYQYSSFYWE